MSTIVFLAASYLTLALTLPETPFSFRKTVFLVTELFVRLSLALILILTVALTPLASFFGVSFLALGLVVSSVMVSLTTGEAKPLPSRNCAKTVLVPSPDDRVHEAVAAYGW